MSRNNIRTIEINSYIFPHVMQIIITKPVDANTAETAESTHEMQIKPINPNAMIDLPAGAHLLYLQKIADDHNELEMRLLEQYSYGLPFSDCDYEEMLKLTLTPITRNKNPNSVNDIFASFGIRACTDENGSIHFELIPEVIPAIQAETWECIIIDHLKKTVYEIIDCFDFDASFVRTEEGFSESNDLSFNLGAWKFSSDKTEQSLSNVLRNAFMFTLVGYCYGTDKNKYSSFCDFFENEYYKRVSLIYAIWVTRNQQEKIEYLPVYDSFYNLDGISKDDLIGILKAVLDNSDMPGDERRMLLSRLIDGATEYHQNLTPTNKALEDDLIKPAINFVLLREKAKESIEAASSLLEQRLYSDCANRCYYAIMYELKALLENKGKLAEWKANELKEAESHDSLDRGLQDLVTNNVLDMNDQAVFEYVKTQRWKCDYSHYRFGQLEAQTCLSKAAVFIQKVETVIGS